MTKSKKIFYWSPHINNHIATVKAVKNSICSIKKFGNSKYEPIIINVFGEWNEHKENLDNMDIKYIDLINLNIKLPISGIFKSRLFYVLISIFAFPKLFFVLKRFQPDYVIAHLIVTPILIISHFFNKDNIKFILRISGLPRLNLWRKNIWKFFGKKLHSITCPTKATKELLSNSKVFDENKIFLLEDPIFKMSEIRRAKKKNFYSKKEKNEIISVGRLTYQKNFELMIKGFSRIKKNYPDYRLTIVGSGEKKHELKKLLDNLSISNQIMIKPFSPNIYDFYLKSEIFISTALWEDPGFTILEAAMFNLTILTSNCPNGPKEFLNENKRGHGFINGNSDDFEKNLKHILSNDFNYEDNFKKKTLAKKYCRRFTIFNHFTKFEKILN